MTRTIRTYGCLLTITLLLALLNSPAQADIYKYLDKHGRVYLTDKPDRSGSKVLVKTWKGWKASKISYKNYSKNRQKYSPTIAHAALRYKVPNALLHAVITAESAYDANAVSHAGAVGLMQLMPATAQRYGVSNRRDPVANISGGSRYLRDLLGMFHNNLPLVLAAYNAGENAVKRYGNKIPPYEETQNYVRKVLDMYKKYARTL